jgi:hypothetical protein
VCSIYGVGNLADVNEARLHLFQNKIMPQRHTLTHWIINKIKSSDACSLPPSRAVLQQKLKEQIMWHMCGEMQGKPTKVNLVQMDMAGKSEVTD